MMKMTYIFWADAKKKLSAASEADVADEPEAMVALVRNLRTFLREAEKDDS